MLALFLVFACRTSEDAPRKVPPAYNPPDIVGPWAAGKSEVSATGPEGTLSVAVWFPTEQLGAVAADYGELGPGVAWADASPDCAEPRPVAVFSHASGGLSTQAFFLGERLATHGWIMAAPEHPGTSRDDMDLVDLAASVLRRPAELSASFDALAGAIEGEPLHGCVDPEAGFAVIGHDLGGSTALLAAGATLEEPALAPLCIEGDTLACDLIELGLGGNGGESLSLADTRVWAALAMAPTDLALDAGGLANVFAPVGLLGATEDASVSWDEVLDPTFDAIEVTPRGLGGVVGAGHMSLTALCPLYPFSAECQEGSGYLPIADAQEAVNVTAVPFLEVARGVEKAADYLPPERAEVTWEWAGEGEE